MNQKTRRLGDAQKLVVSNVMIELQRSGRAAEMTREEFCTYLEEHHQLDVSKDMVKHYQKTLKDGLEIDVQFKETVYEHSPIAVLYKRLDELDRRVTELEEAATRPQLTSVDKKY